MVEIIPKESSRPLFTSSTFLSLGFMLLLISVGAYLFFQYRETKATAELKLLEEAINAKKTPEERTLEETMFLYQSKIKDFSTLVQSKTNVLGSLNFLERFAHPQVAFSDFNLNSSARTLHLQGRTQDFTTLHEQILILKSQQEVESLKISNLLFGEKGNVEFSLDINLDPAVFQ